MTEMSCMAPAMIPLCKIVLGVALSLGASICLGDELPSLAGVARGDVAVSAAGESTLAFSDIIRLNVSEIVDQTYHQSELA